MWSVDFGQADWTGRPETRREIQTLESRFDFVPRMSTMMAIDIKYTIAVAVVVVVLTALASII